MGKGKASPAAKKAGKLRAKVKAGGKLTAEQQAFMDGYEPAKAGRPVAESSAPMPDVPEPEQISLPLGDPAIAPEFQAGPGTTPPAPDSPPVTPRAETHARGSKPGKSDWRAKYRISAAEGEREATCVQIASWWGQALSKANASIVANGGTPAFPDDMIMVRETIEESGIKKIQVKLGPIGGCMVLAVDKMLPADFSIGPEVQAAVATSVVTAQVMFQARRKKKTESASERAARTWVNRDQPKAPDPAPSESKVPTPATDDGGDVPKAPAGKAPITGADMIRINPDRIF